MQKSSFTFPSRGELKKFIFYSAFTFSATTEGESLRREKRPFTAMSLSFSKISRAEAETKLRK